MNEPTTSTECLWSLPIHFKTCNTLPTFLIPGEVIYFTEPNTEFFLSLSQYITFVPTLIFERKHTAEKLKQSVGLTIIPIFPADRIVSPLVSMLLTKCMPVQHIAVTSDSQRRQQNQRNFKTVYSMQTKGKITEDVHRKHRDYMLSEWNPFWAKALRDIAHACFLVGKKFSSIW